MSPLEWLLCALTHSLMFFPCSISLAIRWVWLDSLTHEVTLPSLFELEKKALLLQSYNIWDKGMEKITRWNVDGWGFIQVFIYVIINAVLSKAQLLQKDIQELLDWCTSTGTLYQTRCRTVCIRWVGNFFLDVWQHIANLGYWMVDSAYSLCINELAYISRLKYTSQQHSCF